MNWEQSDRHKRIMEVADELTEKYGSYTEENDCIVNLEKLTFVGSNRPAFNNSDKNERYWFSLKEETRETSSESDYLTDDMSTPEQSDNEDLDAELEDDSKDKVQHYRLVGVREVLYDMLDRNKKPKKNKSPDHPPGKRMHTKERPMERKRPRLNEPPKFKPPPEDSELKQHVRKSLDRMSRLLNDSGSDSDDHEYYPLRHLSEHSSANKSDRDFSRSYDLSPRYNLDSSNLYHDTDNHENSSMLNNHLYQEANSDNSLGTYTIDEAAGSQKDNSYETYTNEDPIILQSERNCSYKSPNNYANSNSWTGLKSSRKGNRFIKTAGSESDHEDPYSTDPGRHPSEERVDDFTHSYSEGEDNYSRSYNRARGNNFSRSYAKRDHSRRSDSRDETNRTRSYSGEREHNFSLPYNKSREDTHSYNKGDISEIQFNYNAVDDFSDDSERSGELQVDPQVSPPITEILQYHDECNASSVYFGLRSDIPKCLIFDRDTADLSRSRRLFRQESPGAILRDHLKPTATYQDQSDYVDSDESSTYQPSIRDALNFKRRASNLSRSLPSLFYSPQKTMSVHSRPSIPCSILTPRAITEELNSRRRQLNLTKTGQSDEGTQQSSQKSSSCGHEVLDLTNKTLEAMHGGRDERISLNTPEPCVQPKRKSNAQQPCNNQSERSCSIPSQVTTSPEKSVPCFMSRENFGEPDPEFQFCVPLTPRHKKNLVDSPSKTFSQLSLNSPRRQIHANTQPRSRKGGVVPGSPLARRGLNRAIDESDVNASIIQSSHSPKYTRGYDTVFTPMHMAKLK